MKEIPILFSGPMVNALMAGTKTQTRRICKDNGDTLIGYEFVKDNPTYPEMWKGKKAEPYTGWIVKFNNPPIAVPRTCPYGSAGDILWVRESCLFLQSHPQPGYIYKADDNSSIEQSLKDNNYRWRPSIHMPKEAARIWLEVINVRVERLHNISEEDAKSEGVANSNIFRSLWSQINGIGSWDENLWVWVVEFKVLSTTGKPKI